MENKTRTCEDCEQSKPVNDVVTWYDPLGLDKTPHYTCNDCNEEKFDALVGDYY